METKPLTGTRRGTGIDGTGVGKEMMKREPLRIRLTLDSGLAAYVRAWVKGFGIPNNERDAIIDMVRDTVLKRLESETLREMMIPHLPRDIQRAFKGRVEIRPARRGR